MTVVRKVKAPGGTYHIHHDGRRVFVPARIRPWGYQTGNDPGETPNYAPPGQRLPTRPPTPVAGTPPQAGGQAPFAPDATYFTDLARQRFQVQQQLASYTRQSAEDRTGFTESQRRLAEQEPLAQQNANEGYNRQGLFYSGALGKEKARLATQYARSRADMRSSFDKRERARAEARRALEAGASIEEAAALAAAVDRGIDRDTQAADANALVPNVPAAPPPTPSAPAAPRVASPARTPPRPRRPRAGRGTSSRRRRRPRNTPGRF